MLLVLSVMMGLIHHALSVLWVISKAAPFVIQNVKKGMDKHKMHHFVLNVMLNANFVMNNLIIALLARLELIFTKTNAYNNAQSTSLNMRRIEAVCYAQLIVYKGKLNQNT